MGGGAKYGNMLARKRATAKTQDKAGIEYREYHVSSAMQCSEQCSEQCSRFHGQWLGVRTHLTLLHLLQNRHPILSDSELWMFACYHHHHLLTHPQSLPSQARLQTRRKTSVMGHCCPVIVCEVEDRDFIYNMCS